MSTTPSKSMNDYDAGLRDGKIDAIEQMQGYQNNRLDNHDMRLRSLERVSYIVLGMVLFIEFWPHLKVFLQ